jgi:hypothetical protein
MLPNPTGRPECGIRLPIISRAQRTTARTSLLLSRITIQFDDAMRLAQIKYSASKHGLAQINATAAR